MQHFGANIVEGVAESWVEFEMSWVEVDGAGWSWVLGLVIPKIFQYIRLHIKNSITWIAHCNTFPFFEIYAL